MALTEAARLFNNVARQTYGIKFLFFFHGFTPSKGAQVAMLAGAAASVASPRAEVAAAAAALVGRGEGCGGGAGGPGWASVAPRAVRLLASCLKRSPVICRPGMHA